MSCIVLLPLFREEAALQEGPVPNTSNADKETGEQVRLDRGAPGGAEQTGGRIGKRTPCPPPRLPPMHDPQQRVKRWQSYCAAVAAAPQQRPHVRQQTCARPSARCCHLTTTRISTGKKSACTSQRCPGRHTRVCQSSQRSSRHKRTRSISIIQGPPQRSIRIIQGHPRNIRALRGAGLAGLLSS